MYFSVVIPVRRTEKIDSIINSLHKTTYPFENIEILVTYGNQPSVQRNKAVEQAKGELVYFFDNDSEIIPQIFDIVSKHFQDERVASVGGPNLTPENDTFLQHCFGMGLASRFANGKVSTRYRKSGEFRNSDETELILCNLSVRRSVYITLGGLNEKIYPNEENEFMNRLKKNGYKLIYDPEAFIYRSRRKNFLQVIKQHLNYGRGRMEQTFIEGVNFGNMLFFIPLVFLFYLLTIPFISNIMYCIPLIIYMLFVFGSSLGWTFETRNPVVFFVMPIVYLVMHISYALGIIRGFFRHITGRVGKIKPEVEVVRVKGFGPKGVRYE